MPPKAHSEKEEADFMNSLLSGVDDSFFDAVPSPDPTPKKGRVLGRTASRLSLLQKTPSKSKAPRKDVVMSSLSTRKSSCANAASSAENVEALLEGAENWDWDDMNADFMTPEAKRINNTMVSYTIVHSIWTYRIHCCVIA